MHHSDPASYFHSASSSSSLIYGIPCDLWPTPSGVTCAYSCFSIILSSPASSSLLYSLTRLLYLASACVFLYSSVFCYSLQNPSRIMWIFADIPSLSPFLLFSLSLATPPTSIHWRVYLLSDLHVDRFPSILSSLSSKNTSLNGRFFAPFSLVFSPVRSSLVLWFHALHS